MSSLTSTDDLAISLGSLILVTGASGHIAGNVVQEALEAGFKVRGTVRSQEKADNTKKTYKNNPNYEIAIVPDMGKDGAFDEAVKGVDAIIHVASITSFSPNPSEVVPPTVHAAVDIMRSALKEPSVKRYVYTSSSTAATYPKPNEKFHIGADTWNHESAQYADLKPPYESKYAFQVYGASKYKAEQAVWQFVKDSNPQFVVNCILPNMNIGRVVGSSGVTGNLINKLLEGDVPSAAPQYMINVVDDARIHLAAAFDKTLANERIYAFDSPFNWAEILSILKELRPNQNLVEIDHDEGRDLSTVDNELGAQLLRKWWGQDGYLGLKKTVEQNLENSV